MHWRMAMGLQPTFEDRKKETLVKQCTKMEYIYLFIKERKINIIYIFEFSVSRYKVYKHVGFLNS